MCYQNQQNGNSSLANDEELLANNSVQIDTYISKFGDCFEEDALQIYCEEDCDEGELSGAPFSNTTTPTQKHNDTKAASAAGSKASGGLDQILARLSAKREKENGICA